MVLLSGMSISRFILSDAHFFLSYKKDNYCKIWNSIIKNCYIII